MTSVSKAIAFAILGFSAVTDAEQLRKLSGSHEAPVTGGEYPTGGEAGAPAISGSCMAAVGPGGVCGMGGEKRRKLLGGHESEEDEDDFDMGKYCSAECQADIEGTKCDDLFQMIPEGPDRDAFSSMIKGADFMCGCLAVATPVCDMGDDDKRRKLLGGHEGDKMSEACCAVITASPACSSPVPPGMDPDGEIANGISSCMGDDAPTEAMGDDAPTEAMGDDAPTMAAKMNSADESKVGDESIGAVAKSTVAFVMSAVAALVAY